MKSETEIPCSSCRLWDQKAKAFSCNPNSCGKLSEWLLKHAPVGTVDNVQVEKAQFQYVV